MAHLNKIAFVLNGERLKGKIRVNVKKWAILGLFFIFVFSTVSSKHVHCNISSMTGFEPRTSGIGSNHSAN